MSDTPLEVGKKLVALCREGKNIEAVETLYADDIVSVEAMPDADSGMPREMAGKEAVLGKSKWWYENHEVHSGECMGPYPHGDRFIAHFKYEITPKVGDCAGKRLNLDEAGLYTVKDGKVVREEFFYDMADMGA